MEHTMRRLMNEFRSENMQNFEILSARVDKQMYDMKRDLSTSVEKQMHEMKRDIESLHERMRDRSYDNVHREFQRGHMRNQNLDDDRGGNNEEEMDAFARESRSNDRMSERHINFHEYLYEPRSLRPAYSTPVRIERDQRSQF